MNHISFKLRRSTLALAATLMLIGGAAVGSIAATAQGAGSSHPWHAIPMYVERVTDKNPVSQVSFQVGFAPVVKRVVPTVVGISSTKVIEVPGHSLPSLSDPLLRQFFGKSAKPRKEREERIGSGVIVSPDGYVLTNDHVVDGATDIRVSLSDGREFTGHVIGRDDETDLAVVKVNATNLPAIVFGDSSNIQPGDFVMAVGNPYGLSHTVTMGIVSATGRTGLDIEHYEDFIQTDAAMNPGNSGGALVDVNGALVGINTAILAGRDSGGNEGIGFAIPVNMARAVMDQILQRGRVVRAYMGVHIQDLTPMLAQVFGAAGMRGALVGEVTANGPASHAGIRRGDIILSANGKAVADGSELRLETAMTPPGSVMRLTVFRNGRRILVPVTLEEMPSKEAPPAAPAAPSAQPGPALEGVQVVALTPELAQHLGLQPGTRGVVISHVGSASAAQSAGLRVGDVILEINRHPVTSPAMFEGAVQASGDRPVLLLVERGGSTLYVAVRP